MVENGFLLFKATRTHLSGALETHSGARGSHYARGGPAPTAPHFCLSGCDAPVHADLNNRGGASPRVRRDLAGPEV